MSDPRFPRVDDPQREEQLRRVLSHPETWSTPPPGVADKVIAAITAEARSTRRVLPTSRRWTWVGAAAAAVALIVLVVVTVLERPAGQVVAMEGTELAMSASGEAVLRERGAGWWIGLELSGLEPAAEGQYYEGWLWSDDGVGVSVGTFHLRDGAGPITLWAGVDPDAYPSLWVTLEDEDGDPSASGRVLLKGRIPTEG